MIISIGTYVGTFKNFLDFESILRQFGRLQNFYKALQTTCAFDGPIITKLPKKYPLGVVSGHSDNGHFLALEIFDPSENFICLPSGQGIQFVRAGEAVLSFLRKLSYGGLA